jgi:hypothetical protein
MFHVVIFSCCRYALMLQCWLKTPDMRPSFSQIASHLESETGRQQKVYVDFTLLKPNYVFPPIEQQTNMPTNTKQSKWGNTLLVMERKARRDIRLQQSMVAPRSVRLPHIRHICRLTSMIIHSSCAGLTCGQVREMTSQTSMLPILYSVTTQSSLPWPGS